MTGYRNPEGKRRCCTCREVLELNKDNFYCGAAKNGGFKYECKKCEAIRSKNSKVYDSKKNKSVALKHLYGLSMQQYEEMLNNQRGLCAVCRLPMKRPYVDHDHETKKVRGLLCLLCNSVLGYSKDSVLVLQAAIEYLQRNV